MVGFEARLSSKMVESIGVSRPSFIKMETVIGPQLYVTYVSEAIVERDQGKSI